MIQKCRCCGNVVDQVFLDLGSCPPSNAYVEAHELDAPETYYPLQVLVCTNCWHVQNKDFLGSSALFTEKYAYFSSVSKSWVAHAKKFCTYATSRFNLTGESFVVEIASNDGYLLQNFSRAGIPCLGIEPTRSTHESALEKGINSQCNFFTQDFAHEMTMRHPKADLVVANNVFAHIPDCRDFAAGLKTILSDDGVISIEVHHLLNLMGSYQFDTIYHEHFSYHSLRSIQTILNSVGLRIFDVEEIPTHGGSLRVFACHEEAQRETSDNIATVLEAETAAGIFSLQTYMDYQRSVRDLKTCTLEFLIQQRQKNKVVAAYGAAAKGNTILNYCGVDQDLISYVFDSAPSKQGRFMPGSRIPIVGADAIDRVNPDILIILPWNIAPEIIQQLSEENNVSPEYYKLIPSLTKL